MTNRNEFNTFYEYKNNVVKNENNVLDIVNLYEKTLLLDKNSKELNLSSNIQNDITIEEIKIQEDQKEVKENKNNNGNLLRLATNFVAALAVTSTVQSAVEIPIFSKIFNPEINNESIAKLPATYKIDNLLSTHSQVNFSVTLDNIEDFTENEYSLMLVKKGCDSDGYVGLILPALKKLHKVIISADVTIGSFDRCITQNKVEKLSEDTEYVLLLFKDDKIVERQAVKTEKFVYVTGFDIDRRYDKEGKHFLIRTYLNPEFKDYELLYVQLVNLETGETVKAYSNISKKEIEDSLKDPVKYVYPQSNILMVNPETNVPEPPSALGYQLRIFCSTNHPENYKGKESFIKDEFKFYLIYTHESAINI